MKCKIKTTETPFLFKYRYILAAFPSAFCLPCAVVYCAFCLPSVALLCGEKTKEGISACKTWSFALWYGLYYRLKGHLLRQFLFRLRNALTVRQLTACYVASCVVLLYSRSALSVLSLFVSCFFWIVSCRACPVVVCCASQTFHFFVLNCSFNIKFSVLYVLFLYRKGIN